MPLLIHREELSDLNGHWPRIDASVRSSYDFDVHQTTCAHFVAPVDLKCHPDLDGTRWSRCSKASHLLLPTTAFQNFSTSKHSPANSFHNLATVQRLSRHSASFRASSSYLLTALLEAPKSQNGCLLSSESEWQAKLSKGLVRPADKNETAPSTPKNVFEHYQELSISPGGHRIQRERYANGMRTVCE